jgi:hypothetical protein
VTIALLDLRPIQTNLQSMVGEFVNYVGISANYQSALIRDADLPAIIWLYPLATSIDGGIVNRGPAQTIERFALLVLHRDINTTPDAGEALQESVRGIRMQAINIVSNTDPEGWFATRYLSGAQRAGGDRLYAWQDEFETRAAQR